MNDQQPNHSTTPEDGAVKGPGGQLREARQYHRLTIDDVARYLRLDTATICNLEEEDYDKLPGPAFIRGYYRAYANALNIEPESILHRFEARGLASPALVRELADRPQMRSNHIAVRATTLLIICGLIALMFSWWQNRIPLLPEEDVAEMAAEMAPGTSPHEETQEETQMASNGPPLGQPSITQGTQATQGDETTEHDTAEHDTAGVVVGMIAPAEATSGTEAPESITRASIASESMVSELTAPGSIASESIASGSANPAEEAPPPPPKITKPTEPTMLTAPLDHLALHVDEDCWIEVRDGRGRQLYYKVGLAGKTYEFQGARPFQVTLGYARGVTVVYNGRPFDHAPYIQRDFAEFSLGN